MSFKVAILNSLDVSELECYISCPKDIFPVLFSLEFLQYSIKIMKWWFGVLRERSTWKKLLDLVPYEECLEVGMV